jgi:copper homeostasis protein
VSGSTFTVSWLAWAQGWQIPTLARYAGRLELCGELLQGGVTPSAGLIEGVASKVKIPVCVLIRPRTGDFLYTDDEIDVMRRDVALCKSLGVAGVVFGALTSDGDVDVARMKALVELARPMSVTFHRAFDFTRDREWALDTLIDLGLDRVLTSGGAGTALEGASELSRLVHRAAERIAVMAGGAVDGRSGGARAGGGAGAELHAASTCGGDARAAGHCQRRCQAGGAGGANSADRGVGE